MKRSFTLIELMVSTALFVLIGLSIWQGYSYVSELVRVSRIKTTAIALANEQIEIVRNLPYSDVGTLTGIPRGKLPETKIVARNGINFIVEFTVENRDDPYDGWTGYDTDYKLVEVEISCPTCRNFPPLTLTTAAAPKGLEEMSSDKGALFIQALNANGQPILQADVLIVNNQVSPPIEIRRTTDINGWLRIIGAPPSFQSYEITVSKSGYSTEKTYKPGENDNPNPVKPHATVVAEQVTEISFAIDKVSTSNVSSVSETCLRIGNIDFLMRGAKLIGTNPDVYKYNQNHTTDSQGRKIISNLEWDSYSVFLTDTIYDLAGSIPLIPFNLNPDTTLDLSLVVEQKRPKALLVIVKDAATQLPLSGATVILQVFPDSVTPADQYYEKITGRGYLHQTDWSGGLDQEDFIDETRYWSQDGNIETEDPAGEIKLKKIGDDYQLNGWLISSTFDTGGASNFYNILWQPLDQPPQTEVKFQIATSSVNPPESWNFLGPDGTPDTYYTLSDTNIYSGHNGNQYLRYKVFLSTEDQSRTPNVSDIAVTFSSSCVPPGQAFFNGFFTRYITCVTIFSVTLDGYQTHTEEIIGLFDDWTKKEVTLYPENPE